MRVDVEEEVVGVTGTEKMWAGPSVEWPGPPAPGRWRSAPAAALLNLTGLGLGYLYLRRWWRAGVAVALTVVLVALAFATDGASVPLLWQALAVVVLAAQAVDGWRLARPGSAAVALPDRTARAGAVAAAVAAVVAVVAAYIGYGIAGRAVHADARAAQARGDCPAAVRGFDLVTGPFELTLSRDVPVAAALRAECTAFVAAQEAQEQRRYADAVGAYREFRTAHPTSVLVPFVAHHLAATFGAWAAQLRQEGRFAEAIGVQRDLLAEVGPGPAAVPVRADLAATYLERATATRTQVTGGTPPLDLVGSAVSDVLVVAQEFGDTPAAGAVSQALTETYTAATRAVADRWFCDALPVLRYFTGLPLAAGDLAGRAHADLARSLLECGLDRFRAGATDAAVDPLSELAEAYPDDPGAPQARSAVIAARVAQQTGLTVPLPAPMGGDSPGSIPMTYYNDSPYEITVRVAGPTAHEFVIPACSGCPTYALGDQPSCTRDSGRPSHTLDLRPGDYVSAAFSPSNVNLDGADEEAESLQRNYRYWTCYYVTSAFGGLGPI